MDEGVTGSGSVIDSISGTEDNVGRVDEDVPACVVGGTIGGDTVCTVVSPVYVGMDGVGGVSNGIVVWEGGAIVSVSAPWCGTILIWSSIAQYFWRNDGVLPDLLLAMTKRIGSDDLVGCCRASISSFTWSSVIG